MSRPVAILTREEPAAPIIIRGCKREEWDAAMKWRAEVCILGPPPSMGSKHGFVVKGRAVLVETQKGLREWQQECRRQLLAAVRTRLGQHAGPLFWSQPISVALTIYVPRPKSHYGTGRNADRLKPNAPGPFACGKPDIDKAMRAIGDCLTGIVVRDDSQIAQWRDPSRYYADEVSPRCEIEVYEL